jgi:YfiH family protein
MIITSNIAVRRITEERRGDAPLFVHPEWRRWGWLTQGITPRDAGDFASFGEQSISTIHSQWRSLREKTGMQRCVLARQVHGAHVLSHETFADGLLLTGDADGHLTRVVGTMLAVSVADCVPVFIVDERARMVAILHAGWRGVVAGILSRGIKCLGGFIANTFVHFGPSICGECYEVGPEVHGLLGLPVPAENKPVDLRAVLTQQARALRIPEANITTSTFCTRCNDSPFFSHRVGHTERQAAVIGLRGVHG